MEHILPWAGMVFGGMVGTVAGWHFGDPELWSDISGLFGGGAIGLCLGILLMPLFGPRRK